jgi:hypothetical protein
MSHRVEQSTSGVVAEFSWGSGAERCTISATTGARDYLPREGSLPQFITEHYWGYAAQRDGTTKEYQVDHPQWRVRDAVASQFIGKAETYYGSRFAKPLANPPASAFLAEGSAVTVFRGTRID